MDSNGYASDSSRQRRPVCDGGTNTESRSSRHGVVLVVDDDEEFAKTMELWLEDEWEVVRAVDGEEAVEKFGPHVDVVLLDRRMPTMSGDEALQEIREQEGDARIAMVTAVDPDWDIVEMDFDTYVTKPVGEDDVTETVRTLFSRAQYAREIQALFALGSKLGLLRSRYPPDELDGDERYQRLEEEFDRLHQQSRSKLAALDENEFVEILQLVEETA